MHKSHSESESEHLKGRSTEHVCKWVTLFFFTQKIKRKRTYYRPEESFYKYRYFDDVRDLGLFWNVRDEYLDMKELNRGFNGVLMQDFLHVNVGLPPLFFTRQTTLRCCSFIGCNQECYTQQVFAPP